MTAGLVPIARPIRAGIVATSVALATQGDEDAFKMACNRVGSDRSTLLQHALTPSAVARTLPSTSQPHSARFARPKTRHSSLRLCCS